MRLFCVVFFIMAGCSGEMWLTPQCIEKAEAVCAKEGGLKHIYTNSIDVAKYMVRCNSGFWVQTMCEHKQ